MKYVCPSYSNDMGAVIFFLKMNGETERGSISESLPSTIVK
ncbi:hypothetical protein DDI_0387 [Dickeya dianthicola RNS04.9]|nr:hypothetical protein DDI_0387 [Dickeya dianthicola RNS04.9]